VTKRFFCAILEIINFGYFSQKFNDNAVILCVTLNQHEKNALPNNHKLFEQYVTDQGSLNDG